MQDQLIDPISHLFYHKLLEALMDREPRVILTHGFYLCSLSLIVTLLLCLWQGSTFQWGECGISTAHLVVNKEREVEREEER